MATYSPSSQKQNKLNKKLQVKRKKQTKRDTFLPRYHFLPLLHPGNNKPDEKMMVISYFCLSVLQFPTQSFPGKVSHFASQCRKIPILIRYLFFFNSVLTVAD